MKETVDSVTVQQLHALLRKSEDTFKKGDAAAREALFTEDGNLVTEHGPVFGRQAIEKFYADMFQNVHFTDMVLKYLVVALVGSAISFALPAFAQQTNTPDPQLREQLDALDKQNEQAFNSGDAAALAALYTEDAIEVTDQGPVYGRKAIERHFVDMFQNIHFSNYILTPDQYSPHVIGTAGTESWSSGEWSATVHATIQGENFGPLQLKGYWSAIRAREGDVWKTRVLTWNITPAPAATAAATPSPATTPNSQ